MNSQACVLGVDAGTSAVRIVAVCDGAAIRGEGRAAIECAPQAGTQLPGAWWHATRTALSAVGRQVDLGRIRALAIDATSGTVLGVDAQGVPLTSGSMYNAKAPAAIVDALSLILPKNSAARGVSSPLARMIEMQRPGIKKMLHQADWLTAQFSGRFDVSDENNALKSGFDVDAREWPGWIEDAGLDPRLLPRVVPAGTDIGPIRPDVAAQFGLDTDVRVVAGTTDGCASFIASGACNFGDAVTSLGTTLMLKQLCARPIAAAEFGLYSHRLGDAWLCGGASNSGGAALLQFFSKQRLTELETKLNPEQDTRLNYYPLPGVGERFPHANPWLEPRMTPRPDDDAQFLQGLLEGIAAIERTGYARMRELGAPALKRVFSVGGGSHNEPWRRIRERILGVPISRGLADAAYGTALIALGALRQRSPFALARPQP